RVVLRGGRVGVLGLARAMLCQLATFHSPDDAVVAVVTAPELAAEWDWVKWLPHAQDDRRTDAAGAVRLVHDTMAGLEEALGDAGTARPRPAAGAPPTPREPPGVLAPPRGAGRPGRPVAAPGPPRRTGAGPRRQG